MYGLRWTARKNSTNCSACFYKCGFYLKLEGKMLFVVFKSKSNLSCLFIKFYTLSVALAAFKNK